VHASKDDVVVASAQSEAASAHPCVAVIGMHRGGTSATAGLLVRLGFSGPPPGDLVPAADSNERGHWESRTVIRCNARLLRTLDSRGFEPPPITLDWEDESHRIGAQIERWYKKSYSGSPVVVKDPRMCLTLSFWRKALPVPLAAVFVLRDPLRVARSLNARDGLAMSLGLALWDRYMRSASVGLAGAPTLVLDYDQMVSDPAAATSTIAEFANSLGIDVLPEKQADASTWLDPELRHQRPQADDYAAMATVQDQVFETLASRSGTYGAWDPPTLPDPPLWVDDCITLRHTFGTAHRELGQLKGSRTYKVASKLRFVMRH
jgi:hypothetical protein